MLPIDALLPEIVASLKLRPNLVIEAAPGAGKTTRVPPALLEPGGEVLVLEPRRLAARMAARHVAQQMREEVGGTVGYQVRFEDVAGPRTRLRFMTEGVLTSRLTSDTRLAAVHTVILDEFHERHIDADLALALLRNLQKTTRPDLRIVIMSATLDCGPVARFLGDCPVLRSEGRLYELTVRHTPYSAAPLEQQVSEALEALLREQREGHVLVFLPGAAEIHRAARACGGLARREGLEVAPLYGDLSADAQDRATQPSNQRRIILSTNIAESSVTIAGVRAVIDSGVARVAMDSPHTGLPALELRRISKASARQRAGRAGRTGPGVAIRLYTLEDFHRRPEHDTPELLRRELSQVCLQLQAAGIRDPLALDWLDAPPEAALAAAQSLLGRLKAHGADARRMAALPAHPRLARFLIDAESGGAGDEACRMAALLSSGQRIQSLDDDPDFRTTQIYRQLRRHVRDGTRAAADPDAIGKALLAAFSDRVAKRGSGDTILLSNGTSARMPGAPQGFFVSLILGRLAWPIEPEWLIDLFPERVRERNVVEWNREAERVEAVSALIYDELVIEESRGGPADDGAAAALLGVKALEAGIHRFVDREELDGFLSRVEFASEHSSIEPVTEQEIAGQLCGLSLGLRSFAELEKAAAGLIAALENSRGTGELDRVAPARLRLPGGRGVKVNYERGKPPWVASRLQDFFGMKESPRVGGSALTLHLLAPNQRAVQTTTDLAGFWQRLYPQMRRELGRRYPRHAWPEDPLRPSA